MLLLMVLIHLWPLKFTGVDNMKYLIKGIIGTHKWGLYNKETMELISVHKSQNNALDAKLIHQLSVQ